VVSYIQQLRVGEEGESIASFESERLRRIHAGH